MAFPGSVPATIPLPLPTGWTHFVAERVCVCLPSNAPIQTWLAKPPIYSFPCNNIMYICMGVCYIFLLYYVYVHVRIPLFSCVVLHCYFLSYSVEDIILLVSANTILFSSVSSPYIIVVIVVWFEHPWHFGLTTICGCVFCVYFLHLNFVHFLYMYICVSCYIDIVLLFFYIILFCGGHCIFHSLSNYYILWLDNPPRHFVSLPTIIPAWTFPLYAMPLHWVGG